VVGGAIGIGPAVRQRTSEDIVLVGLIAETLDGLVLLREDGRLTHVVAQARGLDRIAMQVGYILCDHLSPSVIPRALSDAIARIHGRLAAGGLRAEIGVPGFISTP